MLKESSGKRKLSHMLDVCSGKPKWGEGSVRKRVSQGQLLHDSRITSNRATSLKVDSRPLPHTRPPHETNGTMEVVRETTSVKNVSSMRMKRNTRQMLVS